MRDEYFALKRAIIKEGYDIVKNSDGSTGLLKFEDEEESDA